MSATKEQPVSLTDLTDHEFSALLAEHGSQRALARHLGVADSTLKGHVRRRGLVSPAAAAPKRRSTATLTRADVERAMQPQNNCRVAQFRDTLDEEARDALDFALAQDKRDLNAGAVRALLLASGFSEAEIPGVDAIHAHRRGERPCRCKG